MTGPGAVPTATYRLQLHAGFGFDDAAEQVAYLAALGVSHLYLSPVLRPRRARRTATTWSTTPGVAGGRRREAFERLVARLPRAGLGIVVDVVPNHMTVPDAGPPQRAVLVAAAGRRDGRRTPGGSTSTGRPRTSAS